VQLRLILQVLAIFLTIVGLVLAWRSLSRRSPTNGGAQAEVDASEKREREANELAIRKGERAREKFKDANPKRSAIP
jgi:hypothetical protein